jgi:hypothetical protein
LAEQKKHEAKITAAKAAAATAKANFDRATDATVKDELNRIYQQAAGFELGLTYDRGLYAQALADVQVNIDKVDKTIKSVTTDYNAAKATWDARLLGEKEKERNTIVDTFNQMDFSLKEAQAAVEDFYANGGFSEQQLADKATLYANLTAAQKADLDGAVALVNSSRLSFDAANLKMEGVNA